MHPLLGVRLWPGRAVVWETDGDLPGPGSAQAESTGTGHGGHGMCLGSSTSSLSGRPLPQGQCWEQKMRQWLGDV